MADTTDPQRHDDPRVERTRAAVIAAAADLLVSSGPSAITHVNVAGAANVSRTTVYNHWATRGDLLRATLDSIGKVHPDANNLTGSLRTDLGILCAPMTAELIDEQRAPLIANMMERSLHDPTVRDVRDEVFAAFENVFATVIERGIADGKVRSDIDIRRSLASLMGSFLFIRFMSSEEFCAEQVDAVLDDFVRNNAPR